MRPVSIPHALGQSSRRTLARALAGLGLAGVTIPHGARADDRPTVIVWTWQDSVGVRALDEVAAAFNASQTDVQVNVVRRVDVYSTTQLILTIREGIGPDLCVGDRGLLAERDSVGICDDLTPYLADASPAIDLDEFLPFAAQAVRMGGDRVIGIPLETSVRVLAINRAILKEAGVDLTEWDPARGPVTFDHLAEVAFGLDRKNGDGGYDQIGFIPWFADGSIFQYLLAWGTDYFDAGQCTFTIDNPLAAGAAGWERAFLERLDASALESFLIARQSSTTDPDIPFLGGGIAFALVQDQDLRSTTRIKPDFDLGATFVPVPAAGAPSRSWATGSAVSLLTGARNPTGAVRFIAYLTSTEVLERYCLAIDNLPSRTHVSPDVLTALARPAFITDQVLATAVSTPHVPIASQFQDLLYGAWPGMISGQVEIASGLRDLQEQGNQALADVGAVCT